MAGNTKTLSDTTDVSQFEDEDGKISELAASTGKQATISVNWERYGLTASILVTAGPLPSQLLITNAEAILEALLAGNSIKMLLGDDIGTTESEFDDYVSSGEITVTSSDTSVIAVDGLTLSVVL